MHIVVCIKQVPDTTEVKINPQTNTLVREGVSSVINPFDMYAIEEALRIKEKVGGDSKVTALSMGPGQVETALRDAVSMGVDDIVLLSDRAFAGADTLATSYTLACGIKKLGQVDLVLCGKQAIDGDTAQVGPGIAVHLNLPQIAWVKKIVEISSSSAKVQRMMDEGYDVLEVSLPAVFTVVKEINEPRMPSLKGKMRAKKVEMKVLKASDIEADEKKLGLNGSATQVVKIFNPAPRSGGKTFTGEPEVIVDELLEHLKKDNIII